MQKTSKTRILVECALMIALAVVLDILPLPKWPNGGSVSVSMVPIVFLSYRHGTKWGLLTGFTYCIVQMITGFYAPPAGTVLAFARSLGEFGATITFVSNIPGETRTIPSAMYTLIQTPGGESGAARLCIISIALAMISLLISEWLARISRERAGR